MTTLLDLADVARTSGLRVIELPGWKSNESPGGFAPKGVLCHHTGSFDGIADPANDVEYANWLAFIGRSDLPPPLCNLAFSAESVVYVCSGGNANHAGAAKASGPMPAASDGNVIYVGIEAMNNGSQGWASKGLDVRGRVITQYEGYVRLCAALCVGYRWPATHTRAHKETSTTGKWDPGLLDMPKFRTDIARTMEEEDEVGPSQWTDADWKAYKEKGVPLLVNGLLQAAVDTAGTTVKSSIEAAGKFGKRALGRKQAPA